MAEVHAKADEIIDYVTGEAVPDIGAEANRQAVERFLVEEKGWRREQIRVDASFDLVIEGESYAATLDLLVSCGQRVVMALKCCAGSLLSREREILAAARLAADYQIPYSVVSDGRDALVMDTRTGRHLGEGLAAIPAREEIERRLDGLRFEPLDAKRLRGQKLIFRSYDSMNVNVRRRSKRKTGNR